MQSLQNKFSSICGWQAASGTNCFCTVAQLNVKYNGKAPHYDFLMENYTDFIFWNAKHL